MESILCAHGVDFNALNTFYENKYENMGEIYEKYVISITKK